VEIVGEIAVRFPFLVSEMEGKVRRFFRGGGLGLAADDMAKNVDV